MAKNFFKENIITASSRRLEDIGKAVSLKNLAGFSFLFSFLAVGITWLSYRLLPEKIPLFYSRPWGEEQLASKPLFFLIPGIVFTFTLINSSLARMILKKTGTGSFLAVMLCFFSFFLCLIGLVSIVKIITLMI